MSKTECLSLAPDHCWNYFLQVLNVFLTLLRGDAVPKLFNAKYQLFLVRRLYQLSQKAF